MGLGVNPGRETLRGWVTSYLAFEALSEEGELTFPSSHSSPSHTLYSLIHSLHTQAADACCGRALFRTGGAQGLDLDAQHQHQHHTGTSQKCSFWGLPKPTY